MIAERHASVQISDDVIECHSLSTGTVLVDGKPVEKTTIRPFQFFTIGTTHLAVGPADKPWPHFDLTDFQLRTPTDEEPPQASAASDEPVGEVETGEHVPPESSVPRRRFNLRAGAALASVLILLNVLLGAILLDAFHASDEATTAHETQHLQLQKAIEPYVPHVSLGRNNERWHVAGYVDRESDRKDLQQATREVDPEVVVKVRSTEFLLDLVQQLLKKETWEGTIRALPGGPGIVRIVGMLSADTHDDHRRWQQIERRIEQDVPLKRLLVELEKPESTRPDVAANNGLRQPIPATSSGISRGVPLPILDVRVSNDRVLTLPGGRQVSSGGWLPDGSRVEEIQLDHAVVRTTSGLRLVVPYGFGG